MPTCLLFVCVISKQLWLDKENWKGGWHTWMAWIWSFFHHMFSMCKCILRKLECTKNLSYRFMYTDVDISWFDNQSISVIKIAHLFQKWNSAECLFIFFFFFFFTHKCSHSLFPTGCTGFCFPFYQWRASSKCYWICIAAHQAWLKQMTTKDIRQKWHESEILNEVCRSNFLLKRYVFEVKIICVAQNSITRAIWFNNL